MSVIVTAVISNKLFLEMFTTSFIGFGDTVKLFLKKLSLDNGDLKHEIDFRTVYATLLKQKMKFEPSKIGIKNEVLSGLF